MTLLLASALVVALLAAAWEDLRSRTISDRLTAGIALTAPLFWLAQGLPLWPAVAAQIACGAVLFALFALAFSLNWMGGGDVKLIAALGLWLPPADAVSMLVVMAIAGGVLTAAMLVRHRFARAEGQPEPPYGVAIAFAAILCLGERYLYQFS